MKKGNISAYAKRTRAIPTVNLSLEIHKEKLFCLELVQFHSFHNSLELQVGENHNTYQNFLRVFSFS